MSDAIIEKHKRLLKRRIVVLAALDKRFAEAAELILSRDVWPDCGNAHGRAI
jgi:hypothetical protein